MEIIDRGTSFELPDGRHVPKDPANRDYRQLLAQIDASEVTVVDPPVSESWADIRTRRNHLLAETDWTQLADAPLDEPGGAAWAAYRQALRDLPQTYAEPDQLVWPEPPE